MGIDEGFLRRTEVGGQTLQRRCFVASSMRNRDHVRAAVERLRDRGVFAYDFSIAEFATVSEADWNGLSLADAASHEEISSAAAADITMLGTLGGADFLLLILPAGFSAGWETGYACARGATIIVWTTTPPKVDLPLLHASAVFDSLDDCIEHICKLQ